MYGTFSQSAQELWDFVRCQRPDGTFYGTKGKCRKGTLAGAKPKTQGEFLGGGLEGKVYDIGRGRVLKVATLGEPNLEAQRVASDAGLSPKVLASGRIKGDAKGRRFEIIERAQAEDIPGIGQPGRPSKPLEELEDDDIFKEKQAYLAALKLNSLGVAHGDLHGGNLKWDAKANKPVILDFDNASVNPKEARTETAGLLSSIGIRLEESGYYDEADAFHTMSEKFQRRPNAKTFDKARELIEEYFPDR